MDILNDLTHAAEDVTKTATHDTGGLWDDAMSGLHSAGHAIDSAVHTAGHAVDSIAQNGVSAATSAVDHTLGGTAAHVFHGAAEGVLNSAKQTVGFAYGVTAGATGALDGMVEGTGSLVKDAGKFATDGQFRGQVVHGAEAAASQFAHDPVGSAKALGSGVVHAGEDWLKGAGRAAQEGNLGEYLGRGAGSAAVNIGSFFIPGADVAEGANLAAHAGEAGAAVTDLARGGEALGDASRLSRGGEALGDASTIERGGASTETRAANGADAAGTARRVESFHTLEDFNRAANHAAPNTDYHYGSYTWSTDASSRVSSVEGRVTLDKNGRIPTDGVNTTSIGKSADAQPGDVGFHLVGDQFNGPVNRLNVVPGNGVKQGDLKSLNLSGYKRWENEVAGLARDPNNNVEVRIRAAYSGSNATTRPDAFYAAHRVNGGDWVTTVFRNRAGG